MNSVMEIGDKVMFIHQGYKWWEGTSNDILRSDNAELNDFVFASSMTKQFKALSNK
jgi:phospholipid/cholesterol/gamma-HCH transport system ATP-binding protein